MAVNTLTQSLGTAKPPVASLLSGDISRRGATSQKELPGMLERSYEAEEASQRAKIGAEQGQIQREAEALEGSAQELRQETERVRGLEQPYQEFQAPQYTAADYAKGAATRALTAVILGGVAKTSAMTQLKAIKAMQDAERDGRTRDFETARLTFDEAEKKRLDFNQRLKRDLDDFEKLLQTDTKAALVKAKLIGAETQDAMVKALIDKQRYGDAIKLARDQIDTADKLAMQREQQAARIREAEAREAAKPQKPESLPSDLSKSLDRVAGANIALSRANQTRKPEFFGIAPFDAVADAIVSGVEKDLPVGEVMRMVGSNAPKVTREAVDWWKDYQSFVAKVRNELFGATLTPREAGDFRKFNIGPATDPKVAENYFNRQIEIVKNAVERERRKAQARGVSDQTISAYLDLPEDEVQAPAAPAAAPVGPRPRSFATEAELEAAASRGEVRDNDEVIVGGVKGRYKK